MPRPLRFALLLIGFAMTASPALAWWDSNWSSRAKVTADLGPQAGAVTEPVGRTQIVLRLITTNFDFGSALEDGRDLRVIAADDKTPLKFHIEKFDPLIDQVALVWVDVPDLAPGAQTSFYIYWNNKNAQPGEDSKATYDPDRLLVYHFAGENGLAKDYTAYGNNALTPGKRDDGGMIGYGLRIDGVTPVQLPASPTLAIAAGDARTYSLWVKPADGVRTGVIYAERDGDNALTIGLQDGVAYAEVTTAAGTQRTSPGTPLPAEGQHHIAVTASDRLVVYVDGVKQGEVAATLPAMNAVSSLGGVVPVAPAATAAPGAAPPTAAATPAAATPAVAAPGFAGVIDEFQIAKGVRPLGALQVAVRDEGPEQHMLTFDPPEVASSGGYFGIIVRSVTIDAWVVIGILGVMFLISVLVMMGKAIYLSSVAGANTVFRREFAKLRLGANEAGGLDALSAKKVPRLRNSPLFRLYDVGVRELNARVEDGRLVPGGALAPESLAAIRSAIEAQLSREGARLSRLMVLLTIAISGGPFLGLLGTVVGVMITFAAIAAAGDVNVNSIAPGIAAALLATVAGLAVAIPALFGYNYFLTRIKDVSTEMAVFVDEFCTRIGEGFREHATGAVPAAHGAPDMDTLVDELIVRLTRALRQTQPQPGE